MSRPPITMIALADALPQHLDEVLTVLRELATLSRQEEGCLRFDVYAHSDKPHRLNTIEEWSSREALDRHAKSAHMNRAISLLIGKMAGIPQFRILSAVEELRT